MDGGETDRVLKHFSWKGLLFDFTAFNDAWGTFLRVHQDNELKQERMTQEMHQLTSFISNFHLPKVQLQSGHVLWSQ